MKPALALTVTLIAAAFAAAALTQSSDSLFSLSPDVAAGTTVPAPDIISPSRLYVFHATVYTVWATMLLTVPAFCTVWFVRRSARAESVWLAFWTAGLAAMLVHLYVALGALFDWNWQHILRDTVRVTIPIPDLVLTLWWAIDVALGWYRRRSGSVLVHAQRVLLHAALLVVFLIGFIREGETLVSRGIGIAVALAVVAAVVLQWKRRRAASPLLVED